MIEVKSINENTTTQNTKTTCGGECKETLCWKCKYATGKKIPEPATLTSKKTGATKTCYSCPWASSFLPVPGWEAEKVTIKNRYGNEVVEIKSYQINSCPLFEDDGLKEDTIEDVIEALNLPVRYALSNRLILWDYYDIYKILLKEAKSIIGQQLNQDQILKVKIAAVREYAESLDYDLKDNYITQDEYDQKFNLTEILEDTLKKYHQKAIRKS